MKATYGMRAVDRCLRFCPRIAVGLWLHIALFSLVSFPHAICAAANGAATDELELPGSMQLPIPIQTEAGTISFWVRPEWNAGRVESHPLLSGQWSGGRSYLIISQGWWEPAYADRLHFILSNAEGIGCSHPYELPVGAWSMVTAVWQTGELGSCKLFVDDQLIASRRARFMAPRRVSVDALQVGSDEGTTISKQRVGRAVIRDVRVVNRPLLDREVIEKYRAQEWQATAVVDAKRWAWFPKGGGQVQRSGTRAIFDEDMGWAVSRAEIDDRLVRLKKAGFNVYVPCVWHGSSARYPTTVAPIEPLLASGFRSGWDPLAYLTARAQELGIQVHPWFTIALREGKALPEFASSGVPEGAYDLHDPSFQAFISGLILDVVRRYPIAGINLDYVRTMGVCLSLRCQASYRAANGHDLIRDYASGAPSPEARRDIRAWQDNGVRALVRRIVTQARTLESDLVISVDSNSEPRDEVRALEGRDDIAWANEGLVDAIFHMDYHAVPDLRQIRRAKAALREPEKLLVLLGNYDLVDGRVVARSGVWLSRAVDAMARTADAGGVGVYLLARLDDGQSEALRSGAFNEPALPAWPAGAPRQSPFGEHR